MHIHIGGMRGKVAQVVPAQFFEGGDEGFGTKGLFRIVIGLVFELPGNIIHDKARYFRNRTVKYTEGDQPGMKALLRYPEGIG